ncbi:phosphoadenosine phosphosulfate reductase family protein (plasmid) [Sutcliffiella horikoshii]|uniref:phosphoadenosine phosphosulfate reductase domain-containing protein n=1 Tax=Sutcliffiella horikoshii TaxID=79883 RepID=UPI001CC00871|nr:phosphoadenosine phosphosulfate reductase family protein [Sutcliffiella horikoshii]UAL49818.1 phosphoadenosine phosphosulfate reductase family protein [Sutcliffiella horikoshii]
MTTNLIKYAEELAIPLPREMPDFEQYNHIHCCMSGGKDSIALVLLLIYGYKVPANRLKLIHFRVDGHPNQPAYFDYEETDHYLEYCSKKLGVKLTIIASDTGLKQRIEERGKWPSPSTLYCSSYQKRDTYAKWVRSLGPGNYLCLSGERSNESSRRAKILATQNFKVYKAANAPTKKRFVDWYRPIHHLSTDEVWKLMKLADIEPHPCYTKYNVSRCSCKFCIFLSPTEMNNIAKAFPSEFEELVEMEKRLGHTMKFVKGKSVPLKEFINRDKSQNQLALDFDLPCKW